MSGVFRTINPTNPLTAWRVCTRFGGGEDTLAGWRGGGGVNSSEDSRHCSVLNICKYFVSLSYDQVLFLPEIQSSPPPPSLSLLFLPPPPTKERLLYT